MPRSKPFCGYGGVHRHLWLIGLVLATGCAHPRTEVQDSLARRVTPVEVGVARPTSRPRVTANERPTSDAKVQPAVAIQPGQAPEARTDPDRSNSLPPALEAPPNHSNPRRSIPSATSLPSDSNEAALDAITAAGKPVSVVEAIKLAFRYQPRLRAQLESIAQAQGLQQIAFSTFLPMVAANYDVGEYSLGVGGQPIRLGKGLPGFTFTPGLGAIPFGLNAGTNFELAELKVQWLLLDFGRRLGRYEQARLGQRRCSAPDRSCVPNGGQQCCGRILQCPQDPSVAADRPGRPPPRR